MRLETRVARLEKVFRPCQRPEPQTEQPTETLEEQAEYVRGFVEALADAGLISWDGSLWHIESLGHNDGEGSEWLTDYVSLLNNGLQEAVHEHEL